jgi:hypothetical protein
MHFFSATNRTILRDYWLLQPGYMTSTHAPEVHLVTPALLASHSLAYVFLSQPHTGFQIKGQFAA